MLKKQNSLTHSQAIKIVGIIWLISAWCDRLWIALDRTVPAWDQSNHLTGSLNYLYAFQNVRFWDGEWRNYFWTLTHKYPPLTYILTVPFQQIFGKGADQALLVNLLYNGIILLSVYYLGKHLFNPLTGIYAAAFCVVMPELYRWRLQYLLDIPVTAFTVACFCCLTLWSQQKSRQKSWLWTLILGLCLGLGLMTKQNVLFFLFFPVLYLAVRYLWQRKWEKLVQLISSFFISTLLWGTWYRTNFIYLFSTSQNANAIPASSEGDPALNTLKAWLYYWDLMPRSLSWVLIIFPLVGLLLYLCKKLLKRSSLKNYRLPIASIAWLALYFFGSYLICSAIYNKDPRFIMPALPIVAVFLGYCLTLWQGKWQFMRQVTIGLAFILMLVKIFPIPGMTPIANLLSPSPPLQTYLGDRYPNSQIIAEITAVEPYLKATVGTITSTESINHNTINYFGALADFQVYSRETGSREEQLAQDARSLNWFVTQTGDNGLTKETQLALAKSLPENPDFKLQKQWKLPNKETLSLYHRKNPPVTIEAIASSSQKVQLDRILLPAETPPGIPIPVTYEWSGYWQDLQNGLLLLKWRPVTGENNSFWLHDRGIGMGLLYPQPKDKQFDSFRVIERTAMLPPESIIPQNYTLEAIYLNPKTRETYPISVPPITLTINPNATPSPAPELDFVTQLRTLALELPKGIEGLEPIFEQIGRFNQYDPQQDYLVQAEKTLEYRLQEKIETNTCSSLSNCPFPTPLNLTYGLALARALQEDASGTLEAMQMASRLDANNPFVHAYLAFIHLYQWHPKAAETALKPALKLRPDIPEFQGLYGIAALLQGRAIEAWKVLKPLL
ncbi:phospholipid carrier-dependent glycosyltransferase [Spirulina sp. 06S082]|uniref:phospholipid carrier-dependent glycosyltransferase n=1 Tax=Spirulina sp. 06S082 TaxID=3110248 RepID=UPI002B1FF11D|nr:phospholipid carrier-dependent glycosyltransferase [Spirulina sp. 06S082]MEA5467815.1 phospholipid carrier-dependent glycosyltransferase [Spirulina sp. 06S082]